jgi:hypothetical protein
MSRPAAAAIIFGLALAVFLAVMGWTTHRLLRFHAAQQQARRQAELEGNVRLALWRMDTALAGLITQESVRPVAEYRSAAAAEGYLKAPYVVARLEVSEDGNVVVPRSANSEGRHRAISAKGFSQSRPAYSLRS